MKSCVLKNFLSRKVIEMNLSTRVKTLTPSPTLAISALATQLNEEGHDVIGLGVGEPDFNTPEYIIEGAIRAMHAGKTKYTPSGGILPLKEAIRDQLKKDYELVYKTDEIIVTIGAKHALYNLFQVILDEGDEVIIPAPYWVSYPEQVKLAGGKPLIVDTLEQNQFKITPEQIEEMISDKTKAIIINTPSNPTGFMYKEEEIKAIGEVCLKHNLLIVSDEIYDQLIYTDEPHVSPAMISKELKEQTVIINGVSKTYAMTGWRIGYAAGNKEIIKAMTNLASHSTSNPTSVSQYAALTAYKESDDFVEEMRQTFSNRLDQVYEWLMEIPDITCTKPSGAFYLFPNVKKIALKQGFSTVDEWTTALLEKEKVALVPGSGFGSPDNVRISYATSLDLLEEAMKRIKNFVIEHQ